MSGLRRHALALVCAGLLAGVLLRSFFSLSWEAIIVTFLAICLAGLLLGMKFQAKAPLFVTFLLFTTIGFSWHSFVATDMCANLLDSFVGETVTVRGIASSEPISTGVRQSFHLEPEQVSVQVRGEDVPIADFADRREVRCLKRQIFSISIDRYPEIFFGDLITASAKLDKPENFQTDAGREFDYIAYLGKDNIYYTLPFADVEIIESGYKGVFRRKLFALKKSFLAKINQFVPEPESALLGGVLLGEKQSLGSDLEDAFIATGLIHIVVLSGYNVSIVAEAVTAMLAFLPRAFAYSASSFGILAFMILTGAGAPIVRASMMAILLLVAKFLGRPTEAGRMLLVVATVMVIIKPSILVSDVSFHLSFLATLGLLYVFPIVDGFLSRKIPKLWGLREIASATISTQIAVLPYLLWKIGAFSLVSPITNIIVLPFIPASMLLGFFTGLFGFIFSPIASLFSYFSFLVLKIVIEIVEWFAGLPFALVAIPEIPFVLVLVIYALLGYYVFHNFKQDDE